MSTRLSWFRAHSSALFLAGLVLLGVVLLLSGTSLQRHDDELRQALGSILVQLSGISIAAFVTTMFWAFSDVRNLLREAVLMLVNERDVLRKLSGAARGELRRSLAKIRLEDRVDEIEPSLLEYFHSVQDDALSSPIVRNMTSSEVRTPHPARNDLIVCKSTTTFQVSAKHLKGAKCSFDFKFHHQFLLSAPDLIDDQNFVSYFDVHVGKNHFGIDGLSIERSSEGSIPVLRAVFEKKMPIKGEVDVTISYELLAPANDHTIVQRARYPTKGFNVSLQYSDDYDYEGTWMKRKRLTTRNDPDHEVQAQPRGVRAQTNDWVLPGEGVVLSWNPQNTIEHDQLLPMGSERVG